MAIESRGDLASRHGSIGRIAVAHSWFYRSDNPICTRTPVKDLPDTIMLEPESCGSYLTGPGLGPQMLNLSHWDEPALPLLFFLPARSAVTYNHTMFGTLTLFRERRPQPVLAIPVLALTLIAPWVLGQDTDPIAEIRRQADQGNASAQSYLGFMYETGEGVPKNEAKAVKWYRLAADQGDTVAQTNLGLMYADGRGVLEDDREAVKWFRLAADQGVATAQFNLGLMYANGEGVPENDAEAVKWFRFAADQGDADAQSNLGLMYANGEGVPENDAEAAEWYRLAADQGVASAQFNLGVMYANGEGVPQNDAEAAEWYRLAADQGVASAQFNLGVMYANGGGVPEDYVLGYAWLNLAATQGSETASEYKDDLQARMTADEIAQAEEMSAILLDRINRRPSN